MKYIDTSARHGWDHTPYFDYLRSVQGTMPAHLFEFASNMDNHGPASPNSLHDSWLEYWNVAEKKDGSSKDRALEITACFLGPNHDRQIYLTYRGVKNHSIRSSDELLRAPIQTPHGDLLLHELTMVREGLFSHELIFSKGAVFLVEFADFEHRIEMIAKP